MSLADKSRGSNNLPRFLLEHSLLGLARLLRFAGMDARVYRACPSGRVLAICTAEERILLQRGGKRLPNGLKPYRLQAVGKWNWFEQIVRDFQLERFDFGRRCPECNTELLSTSKDKILGRVPTEVSEHHHQFKSCLGCGRVYWAGGQYRSLRERMLHLLAIVAKGEQR